MANTATRIMKLLNAVCYAFPTPIIVNRCADVLRNPRGTVWQQLNRLEDCNKVVKIGGDPGETVRWLSRKWTVGKDCIPDVVFDITQLKIKVDELSNDPASPSPLQQNISATRNKLPDRRRCLTQKVKIDGQTIHYSIGLYENGDPGELFVDVHRAGSALRDWIGDMAKMLSISLQHGTPLLTALNLFIGTQSTPAGIVTGHQDIKHCTSIMDCIARDMAITFLGMHQYRDPHVNLDAMSQCAIERLPHAVIQTS